MDTTIRNVAKTIVLCYREQYVDDTELEKFKNFLYDAAPILKSLNIPKKAEMALDLATEIDSLI